jgi:sec-independent protein translocase protein TatB
VTVFGSLGFPELLFIFVIALLLFGPKQLPHIGRSLGRALGEFRRASNDFKRTIEEEVAADEIRNVERDLKKSADEISESVKEQSATAADEKEPPKAGSGQEREDG